MMKKCVKCGWKITGEEISEWKAEHEEFSEHPLICPDCWADYQSKDLEDQLDEAMAMPFI